MHAEFYDLMQIFTKNQQYTILGENVIIKIQIELQELIKKMEEYYKTHSSHPRSNFPLPLELVNALHGY